MPRLKLSIPLLLFMLTAAAPPLLAAPGDGVRGHPEQPPVATATAAVPAGAVIGPMINVADIARARRFYVDGLGMRVNMTMGSPARRETILGFGNDPSQPGIILLADETAAAPRAVAHGTGYERLVLRMANLDATAERLKAAGFAPGAIRDVSMGYRMMMVSDADGYKLELVERRPRR